MLQLLHWSSCRRKLWHVGLLIYNRPVSLYDRSCYRLCHIIAFVISFASVHPQYACCSGLLTVALELSRLLRLVEIPITMQI